MDEDPFTKIEKRGRGNVRTVKWCQFGHVMSERPLFRRPLYRRSQKFRDLENIINWSFGERGNHPEIACINAKTESRTLPHLIFKWAEKVEPTEKT